MNLHTDTRHSVWHHN